MVKEFTWRRKIEKEMGREVKVSEISLGGK
jgi:hypothetical protein